MMGIYGDVSELFRRQKSHVQPSCFILVLKGLAHLFVVYFVYVF